MAYKFSVLLASQYLLLPCLSLPQLFNTSAGSPPASLPISPASSRISLASTGIPATIGTPAATTAIPATCIDVRVPSDPAGSDISAALTSASAVANACGGAGQRSSTAGLLSIVYFNVDSVFLNVSHNTNILAPIGVGPTFCPNQFQSIIDQCITNGNAWGGWIGFGNVNYSITNFIYPANGLNPPPPAGGPGTGTGTGTPPTGTGTGIQPPGMGMDTRFPVTGTDTIPHTTGTGTSPPGTGTGTPPPGTGTGTPSSPLPNEATVVIATINSQIISETFIPTTNPQLVSLATTLSTFSTNSLGSTISYQIGPGGVEWQPLTPSGTGNPDLPPPTNLPPNVNSPPKTPTPTPSQPSTTSSSQPTATSTPGQTNVPPPGTTNPPGTTIPTGALSAITSYSSDFSSVATVVGITANTHISTSDGSHHGGIYPFVFGCWFCGGGGFVLWGMTLPGIYPPPINPPVPHWPTITIGNDGDPTPDPSESPTASPPSNSQPTQSQTSHPSSTQHTSTASSCVSSSIPSCTQVVSVSASSTFTSTSCTTVFACSGKHIDPLGAYAPFFFFLSVKNYADVDGSGTATTGASTATASGGLYCSPGSCGGSCSAPTGAAKRSELLPIEGRLIEPEDYAIKNFAKGGLLSRTENEVVEHGLSSLPQKRGYIEMPGDSDFNNNMDQFITEQIGYPGALPLFLPDDNPNSTARVIAFDSPPESDNFNYLPSVSGLEGCTSIIVRIQRAQMLR